MRKKGKTRNFCIQRCPGFCSLRRSSQHWRMDVFKSNWSWKWIYILDYIWLVLMYKIFLILSYAQKVLSSYTHYIKKGQDFLDMQYSKYSQKHSAQYMRTDYRPFYPNEVFTNNIFKLKLWKESWLILSPIHSNGFE